MGEGCRYGTNRPTQRDRAYRELRAILLKGGVPPGQRITETDWAKRLGISRGPLREALGVLANEELLEHGPAGGFFSPRLDEETIRFIMEARWVVEVGALRLAAAAGPPAALAAELDRQCELMERMLEQGFELGFNEADRRFHETLVRAAGNPRLEAMFKRAPLPILTAAGSAPGRNRQSLKKTVNEHRRLCAQIKQGRIESACRLLEAHLLQDRKSRIQE